MRNEKEWILQMDKIYNILRKIKLRNIIILIVILAFNTYAWFVYNTKVAMDLSVHVSSWDITFVGDDHEIKNDMVIEVERIYPGMETFEKTITVNNNGEAIAELDYEIKSLKIMDEVYDAENDSTITSEIIENKMTTEYPFKIRIIKSDEQLISGTGNGFFKISVEWPYESGNDELDTFWGNKAYEYYSLNPGEKCIQLKLELIAKQKAES
jgi:hypothetical protein